MEGGFTSPVRTECGMFVMCCMQCCMSMSAVCSRVVVLGLSVRLSWYPM